MNKARTAIESAIGNNSPVADMSTSDDMLAMLMRREAYAARPYQLQDGRGLTWGYGHKQQLGEVAPDFISRPDAYALLADDVVNRAEKWVKLYVDVELLQNEFDALVSIAFNMSPQSFKKFAQAVNAGDGIDAIAQRSVTWVNPLYTRGIQNRRNEEMRVFNNGIYTV
ncbi:MAG: lysozyme [Candidatus Aquirickettsiella gammari]